MSFLQCLHVSTRANETVLVYIAAFIYIRDPKYHGWTNHIDTRYHHIQDVFKRRCGPQAYIYYSYYTRPSDPTYCEGCFSKSVIERVAL